GRERAIEVTASRRRRLVPSSQIPACSLRNQAYPALVPPAVTEPLMRRSLVIGLLGALAVLACVVPRARACSCIANDFYAALAGSNAVFLGEVLDTSSPASEYPPSVSVTVRVETAW